MTHDGRLGWRHSLLLSCGADVSQTHSGASAGGTEL